MRSIVALRPSSRWSWALRLRSGRSTTWPPRANGRPRPTIPCSPRTRRRPRRPDRVTVTRPCRCHDVLRRGADRALDHRPDGRVGVGELAALAVAEREDVQQQRLLDLGRVEQAAAALRGDLGWSGSMIAAPRTASSARRGEHREGVDVRARHDRRGRLLGRRDGRHEAPAGRAAHDDVRRQQRAGERLGRASARRATSVVFSTPRDADQPGEVLGRQPRPPAHRPGGERRRRPPRAARSGAPRRPRGSARSP